VYIQECIKGVGGITGDDAQAILDGRGLICAWWRRTQNRIRPEEIQARLTQDELNLHVNHFTGEHPTRGGRVGDQSPFISLTAGTVERRHDKGRNDEWKARQTALDFAFGAAGGRDAYLFYCWVIVGLRPAVEIRHLAEEVRELNTYRAYSLFQREGEVLAKIEVPARQIKKYERWEFRDTPDGLPEPACTELVMNDGYIPPDTVTNYRDLI
jgi:hypothetical protein